MLINFKLKFDLNMYMIDCYFFQHFPNLKKADIQVQFQDHIEPHQMLSQIFPNVRGLTWMRLELKTDRIREKSYRPVSCNVFVDVTNFPLLEHFAFFCYCIMTTGVESFLKKWTENCPKLRELELGRNLVFN